MKVRTKVKAGGTGAQHNETLVRGIDRAKGLKVRTKVKAGGTLNHNETLISATAKARR